MAVFRRKPRYVPLVVPALDGSTWPDRATAGPSFDALTLYQLGYREAFEPEAHALADRLVQAVLGRVPTEVSAEDEPYLNQVFTSAARIGAGIGTVETNVERPDDGLMDRRTWGALWQARRELPGMHGEQARLAAYFILAGHYVARGGPEAVPQLLDKLP